MASDIVWFSTQRHLSFERFRPVASFISMQKGCRLMYKSTLGRTSCLALSRTRQIISWNGRKQLAVVQKAPKIGGQGRIMRTINSLIEGLSTRRSRPAPSLAEIEAVSSAIGSSRECKLSLVECQGGDLSAEH